MPKMVIEEMSEAEIVATYEVPNGLSEAELKSIMQRLVCRNLTQEEIINSSRRRDDKKRASLLDRVGRDRPILYGEDPSFVLKKLDS